MLNAADTGTIITGKKLGPTRTLKNELVAKIIDMESRGASADELQTFIGTGRARKAQIEGDIINGEAYCGAIVGMIREITGAGEVVQSIVEDSKAVIDRLL